jgi:hypothetical protein
MNMKIAKSSYCKFVTYYDSSPNSGAKVKVGARR